MYEYNRHMWASVIAGVIVAGLLGSPATVVAQGRIQTVQCASSNGHRTFCEADTHRGVRLVRQFGGGRCEEGQTWGFTEQGVWVDRGCRAEFELRDPRRPAPVVERVDRIEPGTAITVETTETIDSQRSDGRVYLGIVNDDVRDSSGRVVIPRGAGTELVVRVARDEDLILDLDSVSVNGERYAIRTDTERIDAGDGNSGHAGEIVGGGALLGSIIGAIAGGGKGAAIGAVAGAGAGVVVATQGRRVRVPRSSLLTFRLERPLEIVTVDAGFTREGHHYHPDGPR